MIRASAFAATALLTLAACGGEQSTAENTADQLEEAAEVSTPAAATVLENAAEDIRDREQVPPPGQPGSPAQNALSKAADATAAQNPGAAAGNGSSEQAPGNLKENAQ